MGWLSRSERLQTSNFAFAGLLAGAAIMLTIVSGSRSDHAQLGE